MSGRRTRVKICGITTPGDAAAAAAAGADAIGIVFASSPRRAPAAAAAEIVAASGHCRRVGVFVDAAREHLLQLAAAWRLHAAQLCGDEPVAYARDLGLNVIRAIQLAGPADLERAAAYPARAFLLDAPGRGGLRGGTGRIFDWNLADRLPWPRDRVLIAGGLTPANVAAAILRLRPAAVDVSSGVERAPGIKDHARIRDFIAAVRHADARLAAMAGDAAPDAGRHAGFDAATTATIFD
jgi:phosphoribosylanthranilate isomerase